MESLVASSAICLLVVYPSEQGFCGPREGDLRGSCHWAEMIAARTVAKMSGWEGCALWAAGTRSDSQAQQPAPLTRRQPRGFQLHKRSFRRIWSSPLLGAQASVTWSSMVCRFPCISQSLPSLKTICFTIYQTLFLPLSKPQLYMFSVFLKALLKVILN